MSTTQEQREAAARAWWADPCHDTATKLLAVCETGYGFKGPNPDGIMGGTMQGCLSMWLAWAKDDASKPVPAPVDALEGVVFFDAADVLRTAENWGSTEGGRGLVEHDWVVFRSGHTLASIAAHARAQLARESAPAQSAALTLEQARAMCRGAGDTVVEAPPRPNYVKPAEMLAWFEASVAVRKADKHMGDAASRCAMQDRDAWTETPDDCTVESEIGRLRALGVTPAVLK